MVIPKAAYCKKCLRDTTRSKGSKNMICNWCGGEVVLRNDISNEKLCIRCGKVIARENLPAFIFNKKKYCEACRKR